MRSPAVRMATVDERRLEAEAAERSRVFGDPAPPPVSSLAMGKITAESSDGYYQLEEVDGEGATVTDGRLWTTGELGEAREVNATTGLEAGSFVLLQRTLATDGSTLWVFQGPGEAGDPLPGGGIQYQVLQRDGAGNAIWEYVRAHP